MISRLRGLIAEIEDIEELLFQPFNTGNEFGLNEKQTEILIKGIEGIADPILNLINEIEKND